MNMRDLNDAAALIFKSNVFGDLQSQEAAAIKIIAGAEKGFTPFQSMAMFDFIQGRPTLNAHGKAVQVVGASKDTALGLVGGATAYTGMVMSSPACVGVVTCALPIGLGALGTTSMVGAWDSASRITADFKSNEPDRVLASFFPETFPGESSVTSDLAWSTAKSAAQAALFGGASKYFNGKLAGELASGAKGLGSAGTGTTAGSNVASTTPKVDVFGIKQQF